MLFINVINKYEMIPNECIYSILLFLNPKCLQLCGRVNNNFHGLCQLDSLWRNQIDDKYNMLFKKENCYENCKLYYQLNKLKKKLELDEEIDDLYHIKKIHVLVFSLTELPKEIGILTNLQSLYIGNNKLTQLPREIKELFNLERLYLHCNKLIQLPQEIIQLTNLEVLQLHDNQLTDLPQGMEQLTKLQILSLDGNKLPQIPQELLQLSNSRSSSRDMIRYVTISSKINNNLI